MDGDAKKIVWTIGAQMVAITISLLMVALIVWVSSKAWKKGQVESGYDSKANWLGF